MATPTLFPFWQLACSPAQWPSSPPTPCRLFAQGSRWVMLLYQMDCFCQLGVSTLQAAQMGPGTLAADRPSSSSVAQSVSCPLSLVRRATPGECCSCG